MGVSGAGKTTVGQALAEALSLQFVDADNLHPASNVAKMAAGIPLNDEDRFPWLRQVGAELDRFQGEGIVLACSALKRRYRDLIREQAAGTTFVHLSASERVLANRVIGRPGHFMPASLLQSQIATLEPLEQGEAGVTVDCSQPVAELVREVVSALTAAAPGAESHAL
ncbi:Thermoresistant gluconokinase [Microbacterium trichothecenolyticum]|uniref:Gluconokinase n=2 Tax=Microbacterium trichothecenolyticum TaxID=69370 RepID=A0A0M2H5Q0_MICTR|nr:Thermoresistant gluconokinase [Microbacterium trichothecenolyticum]